MLTLDNFCKLTAAAGAMILVTDSAPSIVNKVLDNALGIAATAGGILVLSGAAPYTGAAVLLLSGGAYVTDAIDYGSSDVADRKAVRRRRENGIMPKF